MCSRSILFAELVDIGVGGECVDAGAGGWGEATDVEEEGEEEGPLVWIVVVVGDYRELDLARLAGPRQDRKSLKVVHVVLGAVELCKQRADHDALAGVLLGEQQDFGAKMPNP